MNEDFQLQELGERRIIEEIIQTEFPPQEDVLFGIGDDCALLNLREDHDTIVISTDPCPLPVAWILGDEDYSHYGWYTMIINISDMASMGAKPYGIMVATVMPPEMRVSTFKRFLDGLKEASKMFDCPIIGGNIKDGNTFTANASIIGGIKKDKALYRHTAQPGDLLIVIGKMGVFWSGVLAELMDIRLKEEFEIIVKDAIRRPIPKIAEGQLLATHKLANSCMDSSDGLVTCFHEIARKSNLNAVIEHSKINLPEVVQYVAEKAQADELKLALSWGDWQLVCSVEEKKLELFESKMKEEGYFYNIIGYFEKGNGAVLLKKDGHRSTIELFDNERFTKRSYFTHGLDNYVNYLKIRQF